MKFPLRWLREFVEISLPPGTLAEKLTAVGLVVETIDGEGEATIFEVDVPPNRPDCMNMYGLAREIAALSGKKLAPHPAVSGETKGSTPAAESVSVAIEARDLCARYCARVVRKVRSGPSPHWMVDRLAAVGLNSVNNLVDVTNYVLWELGHPLHAFDLAQIKGRRIVVRRARKGEPIQTLDGIVRHLDPEMLVIADAERAVGLAGVMGGANTMISPATVDVLLESAWFDPVSVRRTSKKLGLSTDASYRFERGADIESAPLAIDRAASLLAQVAGGEVAPGLIDARVEGGSGTRRVHLRLGRVENVVGMRVEADRAGESLQALGFEPHRSDDGFEIVVPSFRQDVTTEADLIEEVARSAGYDAVPETMPLLPGSGTNHRFAHRREDALHASFTASGYTEVITYSFVSADQDWLFREEGAAPVALSNPMAEGQEIMRTSLLPGLAGAVRLNLNRGVKDVRVFEVGRVFRRVETPRSHEDRKHAPPPGCEEILFAGLAASGLARPKHWVEAAREAGLYDVKGAIEEALSRTGLRVSFAPLDPPGAFRPGQAASIVHGGRGVGRIGVLSGEAASKLGIRSDTILAEINLGELFAAPEERTLVGPLPRYPSAVRDLALVVARGTRWADIERTIRETGGGIVAKVSVFDRYEGASLEKDRLSLAVSIQYQHTERTLAAEEISAAEANVLSALRERHGITLRQT